MVVIRGFEQDFNINKKFKICRENEVEGNKKLLVQVFIKGSNLDIY